MIDKKQYQRAFGVLHASQRNFKEETRMKTNHFPLRRVLALCAVLALMLGLAAVCYGADVGGIRRAVQIWVHGDQTTAVMDIENGSYTLSYEDAEGKLHQRGGGGVALGPFGQERPLTEEELLEHLNQPEVDYHDDGTVWVYWQQQTMEITDRFDDGVCFLQLKNGEETMYLTILYDKGYSMSSFGFVQPEDFN